MMIRIIYANGAYDVVKDKMLDRLLEHGDIAGFQRCDGWAVVGRDRLRQRSRQDEGPFPGPERRGKEEGSKLVRW